MSAGPPSYIVPTFDFSSEFRVDAGFLVQATNAVSGSIPNRCVARLATNGNDID